MANIRTDKSQWPIIVHTSEGVMGPEDTRVLLDELDQIMARKERHVCVFDSTRLSKFQIGDRDRIVKWMKDNDAALRLYSAGTAAVLASGALRFVISSVLLVYRPASPIKCFAELDPAFAWARERLGIAQTSGAVSIAR